MTIFLIIAFVVVAAGCFGLGVWYANKNKASTSAAINTADTVANDVKK